MMDANGTMETSSWEKKEAKLMWRGVPMVDVRQVRLSFTLFEPRADYSGAHEG